MLSEIKIRCFLKVYELNSFTKAGQELFIPQQAVSRYINSLEVDLGVLLFNRTKNHVSVTEEGEAFYHFACTVNEAYQTFRNKLSDLSISKEIKIGYQNWLDFGGANVQAVKKMKDKFPDIVLNDAPFLEGRSRKQLANLKSNSERTPRERKKKAPPTDNSGGSPSRTFNKYIIQKHKKIKCNGTLRGAFVMKERDYNQERFRGAAYPRSCLILQKNSFSI